MQLYLKFRPRSARPGQVRPNFPNKAGTRFIVSAPGWPDQSDQSDCLPGWCVKPVVRVPVFMGVFVEKCGAFVHY